MATSSSPTTSQTAGYEVYRNLQLAPSRKETRLLRLCGGYRHPEEAVHADLIKVSLDDGDVDFKALSYAWGVPDANAPPLIIQINGHPFPVSGTVFVALQKIRRRFCSSGESVNLWIDSICINQVSIAEKNHQVPLMSDIYRRASQVVVWLGDCRRGETIRMLNVLQATLAPVPPTCMSQGDDYVPFEFVPGTRPCPHDPKPVYLNMLDKRPRSPDSLFDGSLPEEDADMIVHITRIAVDFFSRPWFGRTWILQEVALAEQPPLVLCGGWEIDFDNLRHIAYNLSHGDYYRRFLRSHKDIDSLALEELFRQLDQTIHGAGGIVWDLRDRFQSPSNPDGLPIDVLLSKTRPSSAKDARDKIYGVLSLAWDLDKRAITVDYGKEVCEVYMDATAHIIRSRRALQILSMINNDPQIGRPSHWPTWVPDFSAPGPPAVIPLAPAGLRRGYNYRAAGLLPAFIHVLERRIMLHGFAIDSVHGTTNCWHDQHLREDWDPSERLLNPWVEAIATLFYGATSPAVPSPDTPYQPWVRHRADDSTGDREGPGWRHLLVAKPLREAIWRCMMGNQGDMTEGDAANLQNPRWSEASEDDGNALRDWIKQALPRHHGDFWQQDTEQSGPPLIGDGASQMVSHVGFWRSFFTKCVWPYGRKKSTINSAAGDTTQDGDTATIGRHDLMLKVARIWRGRKAFRTRNGWIGFGPRYMEPGDVVAILVGADVPFVLRPTPEHPAVFTMVGECYVEGLMFGELFGECPGFDQEMGEVHYQMNPPGDSGDCCRLEFNGFSEPLDHFLVK
ncbi:hypothetical protein OQA88_2602 [Cercophora sp. LCS_1]